MVAAAAAAVAAAEAAAAASEAFSRFGDGAEASSDLRFVSTPPVDRKHEHQRDDRWRGGGADSRSLPRA